MKLVSEVYSRSRLHHCCWLCLLKKFFSTEFRNIFKTSRGKSFSRQLLMQFPTNWKILVELSHIPSNNSPTAGNKSCYDKHFKSFWETNLSDTEKLVLFCPKRIIFETQKYMYLPGPFFLKVISETIVNCQFYWFSFYFLRPLVKKIKLISLRLSFQFHSILSEFPKSFPIEESQKKHLVEIQMER